MTYKVISERPGFVKDEVSGGILNTDSKALENYKRQKKLLGSINSYEARISYLEQQVLELSAIVKEMLKN